VNHAGDVPARASDEWLQQEGPASPAVPSASRSKLRLLRGSPTSSLGAVHGQGSQESSDVTASMASPFDASYTVFTIRFWKVPWHRRALEVLAEAISPSNEADYLTYEYHLLQRGNELESQMREAHKDDHPDAWRTDPGYGALEADYGPIAERHAACLCRWMRSRRYPETQSAHGGIGNAGERANNLLADLHKAESQVPQHSTPFAALQFVSTRLMGSVA
jgi:hypothetical protein